MKYFAYGSNLSRQRFLRRIPAAKRLFTARLDAHSLRFHKVSQDGSGKCDAYFTGQLQDVVYGLMWDISQDDAITLDRIEGRGAGYERKKIQVHSPKATLVEAMTYIATNTDRELQPYSWYRRHVLIGAAECDLPGHYIDRIEAISPWADPDRQRDARERENHLESG